MTFSSTTPTEVIIFHTEPGGYSALIAWLTSGRSGSSNCWK